MFIPSEKIKDPADPVKAIGVVSFDYSITDDLKRDIPQDYIYRQTRTLRSDLLSRYPDVHSPIHSKFQNRIVILIDDLVQTSDKLLGCLRTIRKQGPQEVIVAIPVITRAAAHEVIQEADSVIFLHVSSEDSIISTYMDFEVITDEEATELMKLPIKEVAEPNH
jgi:predicted phosphoribosyltransferase